MTASPLPVAEMQDRLLQEFEALAAAKQSKRLSLYETIAQNLIGQIFAYVILTAFGETTATSLKIQAVFLVVAFARGYVIRRVFNSIRERGR
jgi:hypothetical protein